MAAGTYVGTGTATLPVSGPGEYSTVDVTIASAASTSLVSLCPTSRVIDANGEFTAYVSKKATNTITVTANRPQLPTAMTFQLIVWTGA